MEKAFKLIARELGKIKRRKVSAAELQRAKDYIIGQLKLGLESTSNQMMWMGESIIGRNEIVDPHTIIDKIHKVTEEEVLLVAQDLFQPGRMCATCVGPDLTHAQLSQWLAPFNEL